MKADPKLPDESVNVSKTHPLGEAFTLITGFALFAGAIFVLVAFFVNLAVPFISLKTEAMLFGKLWDQIEAEQDIGFGAMEPSEDLTALVAELASHWPENPYSYRVATYEDTNPNALALPGGLILVSSGLLDTLDSKNELAFVLGHELGHFHNRDHLKALGRGVIFQVLLGLTGTSGNLGSLTSQLSNNRFSRGAEQQADRFGLGLLQQSYGHVSGSLDFFDKLSQNESQFDRALASYTGTHPSSDKRIRQLENYANSQGWSFQGERLTLP